MESFLETLTKDLYTKYGTGISDLVMVFPNQRAGVFFNKYLSKLIDNPVWLPEITTINVLFQKEANLSIADPLTLNFKLYKQYKQLTNSEETFDRFHYWGEMLLNDFDDIDKYLINVQDMFRNLRSIKAIDNSFDYLTQEQIDSIKQFWSAFTAEKLSQHQDDFIQVWEVLFALYTNFKKDISEEGYAYEGMAYRQIAEKIQNKDFGGLKYKRYVFAGFNALNKCEEELFSYLTNIKNADFYWDFDEYYLQDKINEAGQFMRGNIENFTFTNKHFDFKNLQKDKNIQLISSPTKTGQAKMATDILEKLSKETDNYADTAVVLADENLLMPALYSLPNTVKAANVTMGYPLKITPTYSFIDSLLEMQKAEKNGRFYHKTVLAVLSHQFISGRFSGVVTNIQKYITSRNAIYLRPEDVARSMYPQNEDETETQPEAKTPEQEKQDELFAKLFSIPGNQAITAYIQDIVLQLSQFFKEEQSDNSPYLLELESLFKAYTEFNRINDVLAGEEVVIQERKTYIRIIKRVLNGVSVSFAGEPLSGLQVLGVLETRLVDFKNLIILSLNEGLFPKGKPSPSFIPYNIRTGFGIPTVKHQDAIFCYYFYRLLQRAENVWMTYSTQTSDNSKGEVSRYVSQLLYSGKFDIDHKHAEFSVHPEIAQPIVIEKDAEVQKLLAEYVSGYGRRKLSPSAINAYIDCPLRFYFRYIAGIKEPDTVSELLDDAQFGSLYHLAMEKLYEGKIGQTLSAEDITSLAQDEKLIESALVQAFHKEMFPGRKSILFSDITGYNSVIFSILKKYIVNSLKVDAEKAPIKIHYLEHTMETTIPLTVNDKSMSIQLYGNADRIDEINDELRIIDYKTGSVNTDCMTGLTGLFENDKKRNRAALQTFIYSYVYAKNYQAPKPIVPAIFGIRGQFLNEDYHIKIKDPEQPRGPKNPVLHFAEMIPEFECLLADCLTDLFNKNISFSQTENTDNCEYCSYKSICRV